MNSDFHLRGIRKVTMIEEWRKGKEIKRGREKKAREQDSVSMWYIICE